jgi:hypothetical protein
VTPFVSIGSLACCAPSPAGLDIRHVLGGRAALSLAESVPAVDPALMVAVSIYADVAEQPYERRDKRESKQQVADDCPGHAISTVVEHVRIRW